MKLYLNAIPFCVFLVTTLLANSSLAKTCGNSGFGTCSFAQSNGSDCNEYAVSLSGSVGDDCKAMMEQKPNLNSKFLNIKFECNLLGGTMDSMVSTRSSMTATTPCQKSEKIREKANQDIAAYISSLKGSNKTEAKKALGALQARMTGYREGAIATAAQYKNCKPSEDLKPGISQTKSAE